MTLRPLNTAHTTTQQPQPPSPPAAEMTASPPETATTEAAGAYSNELAHLDSITLNGFETADLGDSAALGMNAPNGAMLQAAAPSRLDENEFFEGVFRPMHDIPGAIAGIESLPIKPDEEQAARKASDEIYMVCSEVRLLNFLLEPGNKYLGAAVVVGAYAIPKGKAVRAELKQKKAAKYERSRARQSDTHKQAGQGHDGHAVSTSGSYDYADDPEYRKRAN